MKNLAFAVVLAASGLVMLTPLVASAAPHRKPHQVCHVDHHHKVCHWVRWSGVWLSRSMAGTRNRIRQQGFRGAIA